MKFEYDLRKSASNYAKHGITFETAQRLWNEPVVRIPSRNHAEPRELAIGIIHGIFWTTIITQRADVIRLISCRRSRDEEKEIYKKKCNNS